MSWQGTLVVERIQNHRSVPAKVGSPLEERTRDVCKSVDTIENQGVLKRFHRRELEE